MGRITRCLYTAYVGPGAPWRLGLVGGLAAVILAAALAAPAAAQQYRMDQPNPAAKAKVGAARLCVRNPNDYATRKADFDAYFNQYYFPSMTLYTPEGLEELGDLRYELFSSFLWKTSNPNLQTDLTELAYKKLGPIVNPRNNPPYHPAVQYNALLVLGMLDDQYAIDTGANKRPPRPYARANTLLAAVAEFGADGKMSPTMLVGALVGLDRHAKYHESLPVEAVEKIATIALKLINADQPIQNVDPDVQAWIQLRAASILTNLGTVGPGNRNLMGLLKLVGSDLPLDDRCYLTGLLAELDLQGATVDGKAVVEPVVKLAVAVADDEAKRAAEYRQILSTGRYSGRSGEALEFERRNMITRLTELQTGLETLEPVAQDAKGQLEAIVSAIEPAIDAAEDDKTIDINVTDTVIDMAKKIRAAAGANAAPPTADVSATTP